MSAIGLSADIADFMCLFVCCLRTVKLKPWNVRLFREGKEGGPKGWVLLLLLIFEHIWTVEARSLCKVGSLAGQCSCMVNGQQHCWAPTCMTQSGLSHCQCALPNEQKSLNEHNMQYAQAV